eukprot:TRINITY_DN12309_c0_g1_i4.p2 TRINITY_DN12309_c0_g1~~TRINITY_DN12309_c0_g1_i4.p2  ORF type:complete len:167 (-),score=14.58 TRINITY_DN12309_c0_g1_i4:44-544(-)
MVEGTAVGADRCANSQCSNKGTMTCARCKKARYCSKDCQRIDWKQRHKQSCGRDEGTALGSANDMMAIFSSGSSGGWYTGIERERVYERIWMSFQLRVEDEYTHAGNMVGAYGQAGGGSKADTTKEFRKYVARLDKKKMLPPDWSDEDRSKLFKGAKPLKCRRQNT